MATSFLSCVNLVNMINRGRVMACRQLHGFTPGSAADFQIRYTLTPANVVWC